MLYDLSLRFKPLDSPNYLDQKPLIETNGLYHASSLVSIIDDRSLVLTGNFLGISPKALDFLPFAEHQSSKACAIIVRYERNFGRCEPKQG